MQAPLGDSDLDWTAVQVPSRRPETSGPTGHPYEASSDQECEGAHIAADLGGNLDRQSECRYRAERAL